jgi:hypothetical protein
MTAQMEAPDRISTPKDYTPVTREKRGEVA